MPTKPQVFPHKCAAKALLWTVLLIATPFVVSAMGSHRTVPMHEKGTSTFYVEVSIEGFGANDFLVDTGASYMTINEDTLAVLQTKKLATYIRELDGILGDGSRLRVPLYRIASINIGGSCTIRNVEAVVFPGAVRGLLGLSALQKTAPFEFSMDPPTLRLSKCGELAA